jgi:periplasmic protein TonB
MNPLIPILITLLLVCTALSYGQQHNNPEEGFYGYDKHWQRIPIKKAKYFTRQIKVNDTCWQWDYYNMYGPLIRSEQFIDEKSNKAHGRFVIYNEKGNIDSLCSYSNGYPHGKWYINNDRYGQIVQTYNMGVLVSTKTIKEEKEQYQKDSTIKRDEKDAEFPGGILGWQQYLNKNLNYPKRAYKAHIRGSVIVNLIVDTTGYIGDLFLYQSVEYSLDDEALRIIRDAPRWTPATQDGKLVKSYKRQSIVFGLTR